MVKFKKSLGLKLSLLLLFSSSARQTECMSQSQYITVGAVGVGLSVGCYALYQYHVNSVYYQESVYNSAKDFLINSSRYETHFNALQINDITKMGDDQKYNFVNANPACESINLRLTGFMATDVPGYNTSLNQFVNALEKNEINLKIAQSKLKFKPEIRAKEVHDDIGKLLFGYTKVLPKLNLLRKYVAAHQNYFSLSGVVAELNTYYKDDMSVLCRDDKQSLINLKKIINVRYANTPTTYKYVQYIKTLDALLKELQKRNEHVMYPDLAGKRNCTTTNLEKIMSLVVNDNEYKKEVNAYDKDQREQARQKQLQENIKKEQEIKQQVADAASAKARAEEIKADAARISALAQLAQANKPAAAPAQINVNVAASTPAPVAAAPAPSAPPAYSAPAPSAPRLYMEAPRFIEGRVPFAVRAGDLPPAYSSTAPSAPDMGA